LKKEIIYMKLTWKSEDLTQMAKDKVQWLTFVAVLHFAVNE